MVNLGNASQDSFQLLIIQRWLTLQAISDSITRITKMPRLQISNFDLDTPTEDFGKEVSQITLISLGCGSLSGWQTTNV
jgi:hypothetical protein